MAISTCASRSSRTATFCGPEGDRYGHVPLYMHSLSLLFPQAIGDGGQGWGNAILYIFLSSVIRERLLGEWCGKCVDKIEDHLDRVGRDRTDNNVDSNVQFRNGGISPRRVKRGSKSNSGGSEVSESAPFLNGKKATGYNIKHYDTTTTATATLTEGGFGTGTDISITG